MPVQPSQLYLISANYRLKCVRLLSLAWRLHKRRVRRHADITQTLSRKGRCAEQALSGLPEAVIAQYEADFATLYCCLSVTMRLYCVRRQKKMKRSSIAPLSAAMAGLGILLATQAS